MNGWQRLWLFAALLWAAAVLALSGSLSFGADKAAPNLNEMLFLARLWLVPVVAVYALCHGLAWVAAGFTSGSR